MRVTDNMKYYSAIKNVNGLQKGYHDLLEKLASQKRINRPSDDPTGMMKVLDCRQTLAAIEQYQSNIERGTTWISVTEKTLTGIIDLLSNVQVIAGNYGTETDAVRAISGRQVQDLREQIHSLANSSLGGNYLFSGSMVGTEPFSDTQQSAETEAGMGAKNVYDKTISVSGTYTGDTNKTYVVRMMGNDEVVGSSYYLSTDGGKTWGDPSDDWVGNSILLDPSDNLTLAFESGQAVGKDDVFFVKASAAGYYRGDGESLSLPIAPGSTASYGTPGEGLFVPKDGEGVDKDGEGVDLFQVLSDLIDAMENDDADGVDALLGSLNSAREQLELGTSLCATKQSRLEMAKKSLDRLDRNMTDIAANTENANVTELAMLISMKETALQSTYALASRLGDHSILNFLK